MSTKTYSLMTGILLGLVCLVHFITLIAGDEIIIAGYTLPDTARWIAVAITGFLSFSGFKLSR